ncbi:MAG: thioredoxin [Acidobacteria bacterium 13_1_20CM_3_53_8]|nr:MAG: thioredoxin [Acidobacteria bacterium 13_1_20CM_3_53_8]
MIVSCAQCGARNRVDENAAQSRKPVCGRCGVELDVAQTSAPRVVTDATFAREVLQAGQTPVLVDCWAEWCGPCRMIAPVLDQLAAEARGQYIIAKLNVDENQQTAVRFQIRSIPTLLIFKNGTLLDTIIGVQPKQAIAQKLERAQAA